MKKGARAKGRPIAEFVAIVNYTAFSRNMERVAYLLSLYRRETGTGSSGRRSVHASDVLRAATVLLHAAVEDLLRNIASWCIGKDSPPDVLDRIPLLGTTSGGEAKKVWLSALVPHSAMTVKELISASVRAHYANSETFNHRGDIVRLLQSCGLDPARVDAEVATLAEMIARRHEIVHHADREKRHRFVRGFHDRPPRGYHVAQALSVSKVERWKRAADRFAQKTLKMLAKTGTHP
jgi:hypothetical protein